MNHLKDVNVIIYDITQDPEQVQPSRRTVFFSLSLPKLL